MDRSKILPLRSINLQAKPLEKRAVTWSCDAELAIAADDSVHVLLPEFPDSITDAGQTTTGDAKGKGKASGGDEAGGSDDTNGKVPLLANVGLDPRQQFFEGSRHFPVSHPQLNPLINKHLWETAGQPFPAVDSHPQGGRQAYNDDDSASDDEPPISMGAGAGVLSSVGSTMNHVVALDWSPSGVGRNRRPVLAVLTANGVLAIYGEGGPGLGPAKGMRIGRRGAERDLAAWVVLWAVGERFVVPGQGEYGERIIAFAWSRKIGPGKALLAYMNDERETVVLAVHSEFKTGKNETEATKWHVVQLLRTEFEEVHFDFDRWDPDYCPNSSCYSLRWSPWAKDHGKWLCLLAHMGNNYVGFRKVVLDPDWQPGAKPSVQLGQKDWDGQCVHLSPDAFLEFESSVLAGDVPCVCRGVIATPYRAIPFSVMLDIGIRRPEDMTHKSKDCDTTYPPPSDSWNPIMGLVVHPRKPSDPGKEALYTLVRLNATATNDNWYETNVPSAARPQWADEIAQRIRVRAPADMTAAQQQHGGATGGEDEDDDEDATGGPSANAALATNNDDDDDYDGNEDDEADTDDEDDAFRSASGPDVYPTRMRLWGLAGSPGGGCTAVLGITQMTQFPERGGWHSSRSRLMFGTGTEGAAAVAAEQEEEEEEEEEEKAPEPQNTIYSPRPLLKALPLRLTTEGKLWEWMYGGGAGVPGVTHPLAAGGQHLAKGGAAGLLQRSREKVRELFAPAVEAQKCEICGAKMNAGEWQSVCEQGHRFDTCGASGLAIQEPGISRACGVCRVRCLDVEHLVSALPSSADVIRQEVSGEVCTRCGGKYLD
ncbi:Gpi-anchor transamidase-like protein [Pleurostoma richardsiae]|uniref:Gpi-anchor transamidase-like protein n=1 Tax=Pleurostoma richardsiae TaxID=41990 RepID=A0AA38RU97_9PEZI|nr:Gpi-anchor transamidase-like protein [Pleurostoma richardsiae]